MSGHDTGQDKAGENKISVPVGGTDTPITGSPLGTGEKDPFMAQETGSHTGSAGGGQSGDQPSGHEHERQEDEQDQHGKLTGSNPDAPGYGRPTGGTKR